MILKVFWLSWVNKTAKEKGVFIQIVHDSHESTCPGVLSKLIDKKRPLPHLLSKFNFIKSKQLYIKRQSIPLWTTVVIGTGFGLILNSSRKKTDRFQSRV